MKPLNHKLVTRFAKKVLVLTVLFSLAQYVFAVDGIMNGGGAKSKSSKSRFSTIKSDLNLSLKYGYTYAGNKSFDLRKTNNTILVNSVMTYKRGNVTYILPFKNRVILQRFKTPTPPTAR
jgi:hypothetical protein